MDVAKHPGGKAETVLVSVLPIGAHLYADVRVQLRGRSACQGLVARHDLIADVINGLQEDSRRGSAPQASLRTRDRSGGIALPI